MRVGSLVKWVRADQDYGDLGVVFSVTKNTLNQTIKSEVHWTDGQFATYEKDEQDKFLKVVKF